jgi:hypothetical protein
MRKNVNATRRFFIVRAAIAKREAANENVSAAVPAGEFDINIVLVPGVTAYGFENDGSYTIEDARLLLSDGREIDGATVVVDTKIAEDVDLEFLYVTPQVMGTAILDDVGYRLVAHHATLKMAA